MLEADLKLFRNKSDCSRQSLEWAFANESLRLCHFADVDVLIARLRQG